MANSQVNDTGEADRYCCLCSKVVIQGRLMTVRGILSEVPCRRDGPVCNGFPHLLQVPSIEFLLATASLHCKDVTGMRFTFPQLRKLYNKFIGTLNSSKGIEDPALHLPSEDVHWQNSNPNGFEALHR